MKFKNKYTQRVFNEISEYLIKEEKASLSNIKNALNMLATANEYNHLMDIKEISKDEETIKYITLLIKLRMGINNVNHGDILGLLFEEELIEQVISSYPRIVAAAYLDASKGKVESEKLDIICSENGNINLNGFLANIFSLYIDDGEIDEHVVTELIDLIIKQAKKNELDTQSSYLYLKAISMRIVSKEQSKILVGLCKKLKAKSEAKSFQTAYEISNCKNSSELLSVIHKQNKCNDFICNSHDIETEVWCMAWGDKQRYIDTIPNISWPTMGRDFKNYYGSNSRIKTRLYIYTTIESKNDVEEATRKLASDVTLEVNTSILQTNAKALSNRGICFLDAVSRAAQGNYALINLTPDSIYGNGINNLLSKCPDGGVAALPTLKIDETSFYKFTEKNHGLITKGLVTNSLLCKLYRHDDMQHNYQQSILDCRFTPTYATYSNEEIKLYAWTKNCYVIKPDELFVREMISGCLPRYSISPCDNFLNYIDHEAFWNCSKRDKAYLVESSDEYIVIEPLPHGGYNVCKEKYIFLNSKRKKAISVPPYKIIFNT